MKAETPKWYLAIIAGGVLRTLSPPFRARYHLLALCLDKLLPLPQDKADQPEWNLAVIAGGLLRTLGHISTHYPACIPVHFRRCV